MNLSQRIKDTKKQKACTTFKEHYPEVYEWFQSEEFSDLFRGKDRISLEINTEKWDGLPFKDSKGVVDFEELYYYLESEGFILEIEQERQLPEIKTFLIIHL